jgi:hypothetical protein
MEFLKFENLCKIYGKSENQVPTSGKVYLEGQNL